MHKRAFLHATGLLAGAALAPGASAAAARPAAPVVLTVTRPVERPNRGPLDKALDQMMGKHGLAFERAFGLDFAAVAALPAQTIEPTLEYDAKRHRLSGPTVGRVLQAAGARAGDSATLVMRAIDGYTVELPLKQAREQGFIIATHIDGAPLHVGGLGPLWAVYEPDRFPALAAKPLPERFAQCPWGLYSIHVSG